MLALFSAAQYLILFKQQLLNFEDMTDSCVVIAIVLYLYLTFGKSQFLNKQFSARVTSNL